MSSPRPGSLGFNGHAYACDCPPCARAHATALAEKVKANGGRAIPRVVGATVFVKAHFRHMSGHLADKPNTRKALRELTRRLQARVARASMK